MADESNVTSRGVVAAETTSPRVPRREALKGLGALAVATTTFAAVGCSSDATEATGEAGAGAPATPSSSAGTAAAENGSTATAGMSAGQANPPATVPGSNTSGMSTPPAAANAGSGGAATASSAAGAGGSSTAAAGTPAASAAGTAAAAGGGAGTGATAAGSADLSSLACILSPDMTEGPFFVEEELDRSDLVMGETDETIVMATPLALTIGVYKVDGMMCEPLPGLQVDIWHADAHGVYSDVASGFVQSTDTRGKKFLRGYQTTNESGIVEFATIYPGWYMSRTIHIHFKIRMPMGGDRAYDFTSQMFFDEAISKEVLASGPYKSTPGTRSVFNEDDHIFNGTPQNGQQPPAGQTAPGEDIMVALSKSGNGYLGLLKVGLRM
jgi:protocatechuate 3,4-dioxygenase beta subunit